MGEYWRDRHFSDHSDLVELNQPRERVIHPLVLGSPFTKVLVVAEFGIAMFASAAVAVDHVFAVEAPADWSVVVRLASWET